MRFYKRQTKIVCVFTLVINSHQENLRTKHEYIGNYSNDRKQEFILKRGQYKYTVVMNYYENDHTMHPVWEISKYN